MIAISKAGKRPSMNFRSGPHKGKDRLIHEIDTLKAEYDSDKANYDSGLKKFDFKKKLYAHDKIKSALIDIQSNKCCFCESKVIQIDDGDVEHFRPKKAYKQNRGDSYQRPGYYWLAYDWDNLFLSCSKCNQRNKKNLFPLNDDTKRAKNHHDSLAREEPNFIHPEFDIPEDHITFDGPFIKPTSNSIRGKTTIIELDLKREALYDTRKEIYDLVHGLIGLYQSIPHNISETEISKKHTRELLKKAVAPSHVYSGMIKANFGDTINQILSENGT